MSAPAWGSGADVGRLAHWSHPGGGTSSSSISIAAARELPTGAGASEVDGAVTTMVVIATAAVAAWCTSAAVAACCASAAVVVRCGSAAVAACCGSTATATLRGASLAAAAAPSVPCDALDERRLVGTAASDLNTLAGARGARSASPCEHVKQEN
jgi:hypothetical protein